MTKLPFWQRWLIPLGKVDVQSLRCLIIPSKGLRALTKRSRVDKITGIPIMWITDINRIARLYGVKKVRFSKHFSGHYYDPPKRSIAIKVDNEMDIDELLLIFSHELAHRIQDIADPDRIDKMSAWKFEREAERLAYFIYKDYFSDIEPKHHTAFSYGLKASDRKYIKDYYTRA